MLAQMQMNKLDGGTGLRAESITFILGLAVSGIRVKIAALSVDNSRPLLI